MDDAVLVEVVETEEDLAGVHGDDFFGEVAKLWEEVLDAAARDVFEEDVEVCDHRVFSGVKDMLDVCSKVLDDVLVLETTQDRHFPRDVFDLQSQRKQDKIPIHGQIQQKMKR